MAAVEFPLLQAFLSEFFSTDHGFTDCSVCVLGKTAPDKDMHKLLASSPVASKVQYLQGCPTHVEDLHRAELAKAVAVFVMTDKTTPNDQAKHVDSLNILATLSIRQFSDSVPIFVQVLLAPLVTPFYDVGATAVICISELRLQLLAASCHTPGLHTLITALVTSSPNFAEVCVCLFCHAVAAASPAGAAAVVVDVRCCCCCCCFCCCCCCCVVLFFVSVFNDVGHRWLVIVQSLVVGVVQRSSLLYGQMVIAHSCSSFFAMVWWLGFFVSSLLTLVCCGWLLLSLLILP